MYLKYSLEESLHEIGARSRDLKRRKYRRMTCFLTSAAAVLTVMLVASIYMLAGVGDPVVSESVYGSYLISQSAGGYVLVAVIAFAIGIILAVAVRYFRNRK